MTKTVIKVENLSKRYRLGVIGGKTLREDVQRWVAKLRGKPDPLLKIGEDDYSNITGENLWALLNVNFEVKRGEILGIIGRNGAGKSTLLKIISQITAPSSGEVKIQGRVGSLLEVGTGFHPELTGRENTYLNGAILGMSKQEVDGKFDEIVEFSELEKFIDTPVKRYSSGMYVRLAFAVAAHLDPEILVVDEVLAVGDVEFQKKCLGKMGSISDKGKTILFVSHNMAAIRRLCSRVIVLSEGKIMTNTTVDSGVDRYLGLFDHVPIDGHLKWTELEHKEEVLPLSLEAFNGNGIRTNVFSVDDEITFRLSFDLRKDSDFQISYRIVNKDGVPIFTVEPNIDAKRYKNGRNCVYCTIQGNMLVPGSYSLHLALHKINQRVLFEDKRAISWIIEETGSNMSKYIGRRYGVVLTTAEWVFE